MQDTDFFDFSSNNIPPEMNVDINAILSKVKYSDKPIIALIVYHIIVFLVAFLLRSHRIYRTIAFVYCMIFALLSEFIGKLIQANWQLLGFSDNYFDEDGVFLLVFFALPPIVTCILLLSHLIGDIVNRYCARKMMIQQQQQLNQGENKKANTQTIEETEKEKTE